MKILMATMSLGIGGAETHIVELATELKRRGNEVIVASSGGVYVADIEKLGIRHYDVPMDRRSIPCMMKSFILLRRIIVSEKPDIVHAHARIPAFLCGLVRKTMRFPFVTTAHGVFQLGVGLTLLTNWGQKTIAVSDDIKDYLTSNYGIDENDIVVTINGIDTEKFSPDVSPDRIAREFGLDLTKPVIGHVGRLDEQTVLVAGRLIALAPELDQAFPGVRIVIAGGGDRFDEIRAAAEKANAALGREMVVMTGPRTDIDEILSTFTVFVGVSRAALEAMAEAKPVILAGNQGRLGLFTPEILDEAQSSNFCCRGSALPAEKQLYGDIIRALQGLSAAERAELGAFGRRLIVSDYSVKRMTDDCETVYDAVRRKKYNVVMSGYYGFGNSGDEAILQSIHGNITKMGSDVSVTVFSNDPADTKRRYGYHAVNRFAFFEVLRALRRCDALVSGGGSLLQDQTSTRSLVYYLTIIRAAELLGKKIMVYANGIGPVNKKKNRRLVRRFLSRANVITLRDEMSLKELTGMGVERRDIRVTADPVFMMDGMPADSARNILEKNGIPPDKPFICVSVRNWNVKDDFRGKIARLCDMIAEKYGRSIVFLAMQTPNDIGISRDVSNLMKNKSYVLDSRFSAKEIMGIIGLGDFVLAMRLHTLIFSARMCVPFVGIIYDPKVEAYVKAFSMPSAGYVDHLDPDEAFRAVENVVEHREAYVETLRLVSARYESLARGDARTLLELLEAPKKRRGA